MNAKKVVEAIIGLVGVFLFIRLLIFIVRVISGAGHWAVENSDQLTDGTFLDQLIQLLMTPQQIAVIVLVLTLNLAYWLNKKDKAEKIADEGLE